MNKMNIFASISALLFAFISIVFCMESLTLSNVRTCIEIIADNCPVCKTQLSEYVDNDRNTARVVITECRHGYHSSCMDAHLLNGESRGCCLVCNARFLFDESHSIRQVCPDLFQGMRDSMLSSSFQGSWTEQQIADVIDKISKIEDTGILTEAFQILFGNDMLGMIKQVKFFSEFLTKHSDCAMQYAITSNNFLAIDVLATLNITLSILMSDSLELLSISTMHDLLQTVIAMLRAPLVVLWDIAVKEVSEDDNLLRCTRRLDNTCLKFIIFQCITDNRSQQIMAKLFAMAIDRRMIKSIVDLYNVASEFKFDMVSVFAYIIATGKSDILMMILPSALPDCESMCLLMNTAVDVDSFESFQYLIGLVPKRMAFSLDGLFARVFKAKNQQWTDLIIDAGFDPAKPVLERLIKKQPENNNQVD